MKLHNEESSKAGQTLRQSRTFLHVWFGQLISTLGSGLSGFALVVWVYQQTGAVTQVALLSFCIALPGILISPFAGALADRFDRRLVMIASDSGAALSTLTVAILFFTGQLEVWHVYLASAATAFFTAFQWPAYASAVTLLVPKRELGRANGLIGTSQAIGQLVAPMLAGVLVATLGIKWVFAFDFASFAFAVGTLLLVRFPRPVASAAGERSRSSFWQEILFGIPYIKARPGLLGLLALFAMTNFFQGLVMVLAPPYLLATSSPAVLGLVSTVGGSGMLAGSLLMSAWGGPKRRVYGVLGFQALGALCIILAGAMPSMIVFAAASFVFFACLPLIGSNSQALWQSKVEPDVQGKVFAIRAMIATASLPLAYLCAGPLADRVFEPLMAVGSPLASRLGPWIGAGAGRGIGLLFIVMGTLSLLVAAFGFLSPRIRYVDDDIPDAVGEELPAGA